MGCVLSALGRSAKRSGDCNSDGRMVVCLGVRLNERPVRLSLWQLVGRSAGRAEAWNQGWMDR
eukprot:5996498-Alexandrium_andersonii.AAC.1